MLFQNNVGIPVAQIIVCGHNLNWKSISVDSLRSFIEAVYLFVFFELPDFQMAFCKEGGVQYRGKMMKVLLRYCLAIRRLLETKNRV